MSVIYDRGRFVYVTAKDWSRLPIQPRRLRLALTAAMVTNQIGVAGISLTPGLFAAVHQEEGRVTDTSLRLRRCASGG
jgi:hypothetical protein